MVGSEVSEAGPAVQRVVVFVQENHTTDNYFRGMAPYGARVASHWPLSPNPPNGDQPHHRMAYFDWWKTGRAKAVQFDTRRVLPYYLYLATTGAFFENHCAQFGGPSTPNHLVLVGGQSPTLRNPAHSKHWDMPSIFGLAEEPDVAWRAYTGSGATPLASTRSCATRPTSSRRGGSSPTRPPGISPHWCMSGTAGRRASIRRRM